jgi:Amt family ammonium transporter
MSSSDLAADVDQHWLLLGAILVIFMHSGFTLLEVGSVMKKNTKNILSKNLMLPCFSAILWWLFGYGFAFGEDYSKFIGSSNFASTGEWAPSAAAGLDPSDFSLHVLIFCA